MSNDPYADLGNASHEMQNRLVESMIARAEDPKQIEMRRAYMAQLSLPGGARGVELGSGPGDVTRDLIEVAGAAGARSRCCRSLSDFGRSETKYHSPRSVGR